jgi:two-component system, LuxR family, sensor kinase FixL
VAPSPAIFYASDERALPPAVRSWLAAQSYPLLVVNRAADDIRPEVEAARGDLMVEGEFGRVDGDDVMLRQVLSHLFRNALEACVAATVVPHIAVAGSIDREQGTVQVTVTDNGPGFPRQVEDSMFRPFVTTKARGTGLGLALVQKIVVLHNGRVAAVPHNRGARVSFTLPLAETGD